ncbi:AAEL013784-PA [Aedes aegypti]|uniref:AAEL013784-PA n=1 Tax=Aedes aegypti TaxID=7159 RepID=Q16I61_AEDAE|nr:AAEL013784-PA [Aedes aegypti]
MEIAREDWIDRAQENMKKFLNRGGSCRGDEPQLLQGTSLENTLGYALSLTMKDPNEWTDEELQMEYMEQLCFYDEESCKTIDKLVQQMYNGIHRNVTCRLTILPIELYSEGKLYEVPLFRYHFQQATDTEPKFIDSIGRVYQDFDDFLKNNKYPSAEMMYPKEGRLEPTNLKNVVYDICKTPAWKNYYFKALDIATGIIGIAGATGAIFLSGGLATPFIAASVGSAIYATGRSIDVLRDKSAHQESLNPLSDSESRTAWLSLTAHVLTFGTMPHISALSGVASTSHSIATGFKVCNFINETGNIISDLVICDTLSAMHSNYYNASIETRLAHAASICFWTKTVISIRQAELMMKNNAIVALKLFGFEDHFCEYFNNDSRAIDIGLRIVKHSLQNNVTIASDKTDAKAITIDGLKFDIETLLKLEPEEVEKLFDILQAVSSDLDRTAFGELRMLCESDVDLVRLISAEAEREELPGNEVAEMLLKVYESMRSQDKFKMSLSVQDGICIGNGLMMGIKAAYIIFASKDEHQAVAPLIDAVLELPPEQCEALTKIIKTKPDYISIFKLKPSDASSEEISSKLRNEISKALSEEH